MNIFSPVTTLQGIGPTRAKQLEKLDRLMEHKVWAQCFTQPLLADLCMPQHTALYADMCDRVYAHMGPALERITAQALTERGADPAQAKNLVGVGLYGVLMMARKGELSMEEVRRMIRRLIESERGER